jgi:hypothetical protein
MKKHRVMGRAVRRKPGTMNKLETAYAERLKALLAEGKIARWGFEDHTLKLAHDTRYTPDFSVVADDGVIELHEVKGFFEDHAKVKIKVAAAMFPYRFYLVRKRAVKDGGGWEIKRIGGEEEL